MAFFHDQYHVNAKDNQFGFTSTGPKGDFDMLCRFELVDAERSIYNFGFGVRKPDAVIDGEIDADDKINLRNGDMDKIFNTVANQVIDFLQINPFATVTFLGSDAVRSRKYSQLLSKYYMEIVGLGFELFGQADGGLPEFFVPYQIGYERFYIRVKYVI
jgi:hypothetical protein